MLVQTKAAHGMSYEQPTKVSKPTKTSIRVISEMSTLHITKFVAYKHRVGLLAFSSFAMLGYIMYDKFLHIFF